MLIRGVATVPYFSRAYWLLTIRINIVIDIIANDASYHIVDVYTRQVNLLSSSNNSLGHRILDKEIMDLELYRYQFYTVKPRYDVPRRRTFGYNVF